MGRDGQLSRRNFLRGRLRPPPEPVRPPWSTEAAMLAHCERCGKCAETCPEGIISAGPDGYPEVHFAKGECTFCGACAEVCPATVFTSRSAQPWALKATIGEGCLAANGVYCRSCGDACPERAIGFKPLVGGRATIEIDTSACSGCGACVSVCPRNIVSVAPFRELEEAAYG
jgi:ferredoxin-type protein NapF